MTDPHPPRTDWSPSAHQLWEDYTFRVRQNLKNDGADPEEVIQDLKSHVMEEQQQKGIYLLTRKDLLLILQRIGLPEVPVSTVDAISPKIGRFRFLRRFPVFFKWLFLVLLPVVVLLDEFIFSDATIIYHDVFPSVLLMILASLVPVHKTYILLRNRKQPGWDPTPRDHLVNGIITMVSLWYTIVLLPIIGMGLVVATLFFWTGFGLLGLFPSAPLFALFHGLKLQIHWNKFKQKPERIVRCQPFALGLLIALLLILFSYVPILFQEQLLAGSVKQSSAISEENVEKLQGHFSDRQLWNRLFGPGSHKSPIPFVEEFQIPISRDTREEFFYRITGMAPSDFSDWNDGLIFNNWPPRSWDWNWDVHQGEQVVGRPNYNLSMKSWRLDSSMDAEGLLAYTEWTMVLHNSSLHSNAEARLLLQIPPGAVVSRVTLWINGEPQEAAFGGRDQTIRAYQSVVRRNRDPLLVTQKGLDHVLAQCFPILPEQDMKIRIGITSSLLPEKEGSARLQYPRLMASNLSLHHELPPVDVWIESDDPIRWRGERMPQETVDGKILYAFEESLPYPELSKIENQPTLSVPSPLPVSFARSDKIDPGLAVLQRWEKRPPENPDYILLIDPSTAMQPLKGDLAKLLKNPSENLKSVVLGGFTPQVLSPEEAAKGVKKHNFRGGPPQVPGMELALKEARKHQVDHLLWIYAPSPYNRENGEALLQVSERRKELPLIHACPVVAEPSPLIESLNAPFRVSEAGDGTLPDFGKLQNLLTGEKLIPHVRAIRELSNQVPEDALRTSDHLVRLWAKDVVDGSLSQGASQREMGKKLAIQHQLVTPLSGAVVLENAAQYKANQLEQADADTVPSIPEPSTWLLALVLMITVFWLRWQHRTCAA